MLRDWDTALVRHIYDTYCIVSADPTAVEKAKAHFRELVTYDTEEFKRHEDFVKDPKACLLNTLAVCESETQTLEEYQTRLMPLVYGDVQPEFKVAFATFKACALELLGTL